jgi:hypothetical protein
MAVSRARLNRPVAWVSVAKADMAEPPVGGDDPIIEGLDTAEYVKSVDGARITFGVMSGACEPKVAAYVYETDHVIALAGVVAAHDVAYGAACTLNGVSSEVSATLSRPIGDRVVIDGIRGRPLMYNAFGEMGTAD